MRYVVTIDADEAQQGAPSPRAVAVDVAEPRGGTFEVRAGDATFECDLAKVGDQVSVRVGGRVFDLTTRGTPPELEVFVSGRRRSVLVETATARGRAAGSVGPASRDTVVRSPMPGRVHAVLVAAGDAVVPGQGLLVLEAMKMENEVTARVGGVVAAVHVQVGANVEGRTPLVTLRAQGAGDPPGGARGT